MKNLNKAVLANLETVKKNFPAAHLAGVSHALILSKVGNYVFVLLTFCWGCKSSSLNIFRTFCTLCNIKETVWKGTRKNCR